MMLVGLVCYPLTAFSAQNGYIMPQAYEINWRKKHSRTISSTSDLWGDLTT